MYYFAQEEYVPMDKSFTEIMDEYAPEYHKKINSLRIRRQQLEGELAEIDNRVLEIQNTDLGGHSAAYYTSEMNKIASDRIAAQNKLDIVAAEEVAEGTAAGKLVDEIIDNEERIMSRD